MSTNARRVLVSPTIWLFVVALLWTTAVAAQTYVDVAPWHTLLAVGQEVPLIGDFDGDGADDVVVFVRDTKPEPGRGDVGVALSNRTRFGELTKWSEFFCIGNEIPGVGDFDGDGKDDIVTFVRNTQTEPGLGDVYVALSNGHGFNASSRWHTNFCLGAMTPAVGDVDGDGKDDLIAFSKSSRTGALEGDVFVALAGDRQFGPGFKAHEFFCIEAEVPVVGDFTGGGSADIGSCVSGSSRAWNAGRVYVAPSRGTTGFGDSRTWCEQFSTANEVIVPGDLDADGKCDLFAFNRATGEVKCAVSDGNVLAAPIRVAQDFCRGEAIPKVGDFDGDGRTDLICFIRDSLAEPNRGDALVARSGRNVAVVAPPAVRTWRLSPKRLIATRGNESEDEIFVFAVGFRSRFMTPNSTRVWWIQRHPSELELDEGEEGVISGDATITFDNVIMLSDANVRAGMHPEVLGVYLIAWEKDNTDWADIFTAIDRGCAAAAEHLRQAIERRSEANFSAQEFAAANSAVFNPLGALHWRSLDTGSIADVFRDEDERVGQQRVAFITTTRDCYQRLWPNQLRTQSPGLLPVQLFDFEPLEEINRNWDNPMVFRSFDEDDGIYTVIWSMLPER